MIIQNTGSIMYALVRELLFRNCELSQLVSNHVLGYSDRVICLSVVHHESDSNKVGQYCAGARFCFYRYIVLQGFLQVGEGNEVRAYEKKSSALPVSVVK